MTTRIIRACIEMRVSDGLVKAMDSIIKDNPLAHILDTMQSWLEGEPVWPYDRIIDTWGPEFEMYRRRLQRQHATSLIDFENMLNRGLTILRLRDEWISRYGFAIPCAELLDELAKHKHVVEVGAGSGYMTRLMRHRGINVTGSDAANSKKDNIYAFKVAAWDEQQVRATATAMVHRYPKATIFCSWPSLKMKWFRFMLQEMKVGQRLVLIREDACAEETAWQYLDDYFDELAIIDIPTFEHMNDYASVHVKKRQA